MSSTKVTLSYNNEEHVVSGVSDDATIGQLKSVFFDKSGLSPTTTVQITISCRPTTTNTVSPYDEDPGDFEMLNAPEAEEQNKMEDDSQDKMADNLLDKMADNLQNKMENNLQSKMDESQNKMEQDILQSIHSSTLGQNNENIDLHNQPSTSAASGAEGTTGYYKLLELNNLDFNKKLLIVAYENVLVYRPTEFLQFDRPQLDEFLSTVHLHYNIVIWSSLRMETLTQELNSLNIVNTTNYSIFACLARRVSASTPVPPELVDSKPWLNLVQINYPKLWQNHTVVVGCGEDQYADNLNTYLKVKKFGRLNFDDTELTTLGKYLVSIAKLRDFSTITHAKWKGDEPDVPEAEDDDVQFIGPDYYGADISDVVDLYNIQEMAPMMDEKKLLVLNLDDVMFNFKFTDIGPLHVFLTRVYQRYNIVIWSQEDMNSMNERAAHLGLNDNPNFSISFYIDYCPGIAGKLNDIRLKLLRIIWNTYPRYNNQNTVLIDNQRLNLHDKMMEVDVRANFAALADYLELIVDLEQFQLLTHDNWMKYTVAQHRERLEPLKRILRTPSLELTPRLPVVTCGARDFSAVDTTELINPSEALAHLRGVIERYVIECHPLRPGKNLLVLDLNNILGDCSDDGRTTVPHPRSLHRRPYLKKFLTKVHESYNIAVWCNSSRETINQQLNKLNLLSHDPRCEISMVLDEAAMLRVVTSKYGDVHVKPLQLIWSKYPEYNARNTIMVDPNLVNFLLNPQSGLIIKPFPDVHYQRYLDYELLKLIRYLNLIAEVGDFTAFNHNNWEAYAAAYYGRMSTEDCATTLDSIFGNCLGARIAHCLEISSKEDLSVRFGEDFMENLEECLNKQCRNGENVIEALVKQYHEEKAGEPRVLYPVPTFSVAIKFNQEIEMLGSVSPTTTEGELKRRIFEETMFCVPPDKQIILYPTDQLYSGDSAGIIKCCSNTRGDNVTLRNLGVKAGAELQLMTASLNAGPSSSRSSPVVKCKK